MGKFGQFVFLAVAVLLIVGGGAGMAVFNQSMTFHRAAVDLRNSLAMIEPKLATDHGDDLKTSLARDADLLTRMSRETFAAYIYRDELAQAQADYDRVVAEFNAAAAH